MITDDHRPPPVYIEPPEVPAPEPTSQAIESDEKPAEFVDAASLDPLTEKQAKVFKALCERAFAGKTTYGSDIKHLSGHDNIQDALSSLELKGYAVRCGERGAWFWKPLAKGEPRIETAESVYRWTEEAFGDLEQVCLAGGDLEACAARVGRTVGATINQARSRGWYREWQRVTAARAAPQAPAAQPAVKISYPVVRRDGVPVRAEVVGDPAAGRSALAKRDAADKLGIVSYLKKKGHDVEAQASGLNFKIDGKFLDVHQAIDIVNRHRAQAPEPLPPISLDGIAVA